MAKPTPFPSATERKESQPPPANPTEKRRAAVVRLTEFCLRVAGTIGAMQGGDRTTVDRGAGGPS
jgi:hypothetical protein